MASCWGCCNGDVETPFDRLPDENAITDPSQSTRRKEHRSTPYTIEDLKREKAMLIKRVTQQSQHIYKLEKDNEILRTRLSAQMSAAITDANPNIADLSDANRPTKLGEQYGQLYDNEWTDAFESLTLAGKSMTDAIQLLLNVLVTIFQDCRNIAVVELIELNATVGRFVRDEQTRKEVVKSLKDERKKNFEAQLVDVTQGVLKSLGSQFEHDDLDHDQIRIYITKCTRLCWLMAIQDPPLSIDENVDIKGTVFDTAMYRDYTKRGPLVEYVVWPVLRIQAGGSVITKGVAQGAHTLTNVADDDLIKA